MGRRVIAVWAALLTSSAAIAAEPAQKEAEDVVQVVKGEAQVKVEEEFQGTKGRVPIYGNQYYAQSFTGRENVFKVEFSVATKGKPEGGLRVEVFPSNEEGTGPARIGSLALSVVGAGEAAKNVSVSFPVDRLKPQQRYWAVWRSLKPTDNPETGNGYFITGGETDVSTNETMAIFDGSNWSRDPQGRDLYLKVYSVGPPAGSTALLGKTYPVKMLTDATITVRKDGTVSYYYFDNFKTEKVLWDARCDKEVFIREGEQSWLAARCLAENSAVAIWKLELPCPGAISFDVHHNNYGSDWCRFFRRVREAKDWEEIKCEFDGSAWNWDMDPKVVLTPDEGNAVYVKAVIAGDPGSGPGASGGLIWLKLFGTLILPK